MAIAAYEVYIVADSPWSADPGAPASPIETLLSAGGTRLNFTSTAANRVAQPPPASVFDTKIGVCGKKAAACESGCETYKTNAASPDYAIFAEVLARWDNTSGVVIAKSSTVTTYVDAADIDAALALAEAAGGTALDAVYLAKWLDQAEKYETLSMLPGGGRVVRTWNPQGFQAIAFTPAGFQKIADTYPPSTNPVVDRPFAGVLNVMVQKGSLYAATTSPPLLTFDATLVATRDPCGVASEPFSYLKTCEVRGDTHPEQPKNRRVTGDQRLFWIVITVLVAAIVAWLILRLGLTRPAV